MTPTASPKVPLVSVCASLACCRTAQMIEVMLCMALETGHYSVEESLQMEEVGEIQKAAIGC